MTELIKPSRRGFVTGLGALLIAAPAIVRATSLMPVKAMPKIIDITDPLLRFQCTERFSYGFIDPRFLTDPNAWYLKMPLPDSIIPISLADREMVEAFD